jgi:peptidoglycan/xylan/chitin deacetylase (PgdA/CDA1 family)
VPADTGNHFLYDRGAIVRGVTTHKKIAIVFTGDEYADGANFIIKALEKEKTRASFFLTGRFYRNKEFINLARRLKSHGHYLGAHSDGHLLYNDWIKRDSLLVTHQQFDEDLQRNYDVMSTFGVEKKYALFFLPPYEWYNDSIASWTNQKGLQLLNYSPGTLSAADYTWPALKNYRSSKVILASIKDYAGRNSKGLNGFILLLHLGTRPERTDKFYLLLPELLGWLKQQGYSLVRIDELLGRAPGDK